MDREYMNRFSFFYTLRWLWKKEGHVVNDLYNTLLISRTRYDQILRNDERANLENVSKSLSKRTGLNENFIAGRTWLGFREVSRDTWANYITNRPRIDKGRKTDALVEAERALEKELTYEFASNRLQEPLKMLKHFAVFKCKRNEDVIANRLDMIGKAMEQLRRSELEQLDSDVLSHYRSRLKVHLEHITALCVLKEWEEK